MPVTTDELMIVKQLKTAADNVRDGFMATWRSIARAIDPTELRMIDFAKDGEAALQDFTKMYDTTAIESGRLFADGMQGYAAGRTLDWLRVKPENAEYSKSDAQKEFFQECERHMMNQLDRSNFYDACSSFFERGVNFATAIMIRQEDAIEGRPMYQLIPLGGSSLISNRFGYVDSLFREYYMPISEAIEEYGIDNLPSVATQDWHLDPSRLIKFTQFIAPVHRCKLSISGDGAYYNLIWCELDETKPVVEELLDTKPFFVWRFTNDPNRTPYGIKSPGWIYSPASRQLQSQQRSALKIEQLMAEPLIKATKGLDVNITPNGITEVGPGQDFTTQPVSGDVSGILESIQRFQTQIKSGYYVDFFLALMSHIEKTKTASEAYLLQDEKSAIMNAFFSKLASEFLEPVLEDLWTSEIRWGRMPEPPASLRGINVKIDFVSPLASQQKRAHGLAPTKQFLTEMLSLAQIIPSAADVFNADEYVRMAAEYYEVDQRVLIPQETVDKARLQKLQAMAQQEQMQNQMAQTQTQADAYAKTSKTPEKGSAAEKAMQ